MALDRLPRWLRRQERRWKNQSDAAIWIELKLQGFETRAELCNLWHAKFPDWWPRYKAIRDHFAA